MTKAIVVRVEGDYVITAEGAGLLSTLASQASDARDEAVSAAAAALAAAGVGEYPDTGAGLSGTTEGETFWVDMGDGTGQVYRHDPGPTATPLQKFIIDPTASGAADIFAGGVPTTAALASPPGARGVGFIQSGTGASATETLNKLRRFIDVLDFIPSALHEGIRDGTNTTDLTSYCQAAIDAVITGGGGYLRFPTGTYKTTDALTISSAQMVNIVGDGKSRTVISRANVSGPIIILQNASGPSSGDGYYFNWHGFKLNYSTVATGGDTGAIGISFETGTGDISYGYVNFGFQGIEISGAYIGISNGYGAGSPPNVWGWTWDDIVISSFANRALYFVNGGSGGFPACRIGHIYIQGRAGLTYADSPFVINSADGVSIDVIEWNVITANCSALMDFVGSSRGVNINILRCENVTINGSAAHAFLFNSTGHTRVGQVIAQTIGVADGVVASMMRITGTGTAELGSVVAEAINQTGSTGVMIANQQDANGKFRFVGSIVGSGTAWVGGDGGGGYSGASALYVRDDGLSVHGNKVVGARGAAIPDATGGATVDTEARAAVNAVLAFLRSWGSIGT